MMLTSSFLTIILIVAAYGIGSIPFGLIFTKLAGHGDIRAIGSGNIGATNVLRTGSRKLAVLTLMNTVNSSAYGLSDFDFQNLHFLTKYFLIFFMIIGRVELLSLLLIAKKFLFKN